MRDRCPCKRRPTRADAWAQCTLDRDHAGLHDAGDGNTWPRRAPLTEAVLDALHTRRLAGERTADLAREVGRKEGGLRSRWLARGWYTPGGISLTPAMRDEVELRALHLRYRADEPLAVLAREYGTDATRIIHRWKALGFKVRGERGERRRPDPLLRRLVGARQGGTSWVEMWTALPTPKRWKDARNLADAVRAYAAHYRLGPVSFGRVPMAAK